MAYFAHENRENEPFGLRKVCKWTILLTKIAEMDDFAYGNHGDG